MNAVAIINMSCLPIAVNHVRSFFLRQVIMANRLRISRGGDFISGKSSQSSGGSSGDDDSSQVSLSTSSSLESSTGGALDPTGSRNNSKYYLDESSSQKDMPQIKEEGVATKSIPETETKAE